MDTCESPDHLLWRDATEDLVRRTETLIGLIGDKPHHKYWAQRIKQELMRCENTKRVAELYLKKGWRGNVHNQLSV